MHIYFCTSEVDIDPRDPRWVGAWWIGFIIIAVIMLLWTFPVLLFPPRLPGQTGGVKDTSMKELAKGRVARQYEYLQPVFV